MSKVWCFIFIWAGLAVFYKSLIRTNIIKVGSKSWLLTCNSNITLSLPSYNVSDLQREQTFCYSCVLYSPPQDIFKRTLNVCGNFLIKSFYDNIQHTIFGLCQSWGRILSEAASRFHEIFYETAAGYNGSHINTRSFLCRVDLRLLSGQTCFKA